MSKSTDQTAAVVRAAGNIAVSAAAKATTPGIVIPAVDDLVAPYKRTPGPGRKPAHEAALNATTRNVEQWLKAITADQAAQAERFAAMEEQLAAAREEACLARIEADRKSVALDGAKDYHTADDVAGFIICQMAMQYGWELTGTDRLKVDGHPAKVLQFANKWKLTVVSNDFHVLMEIPGYMHPERAEIDFNGFTSSGWTSFYGYYAKSTLSDDEKAMMEERIRAATYVNHGTSVSEGDVADTDPTKVVDIW